MHAEALPEWVNWIAQDADGAWWGYEVEPLQAHTHWYENEVGRYLSLGRDQPNPDWAKTLRPVGNRSGAVGADQPRR